MLGNRLEFSQFGHFNYFSVCRSLTPMDPTNLPTPIATGLTTMYYFDSDVLDVLDRNLYYRASVHRDDEVLVSDEVMIYINSFSEPQRLTVIFDHTNLELISAWDVEGSPTGHHYYCSENPFTAETKPAAKAVLANDVRTYVDTAVEAGKTYYVAVGSVKNGVEKLSHILEVSTTHDVNADAASSLLNFENGLIDKKGLIWTASGNAVVSSTQKKFGDFSLFSSSGGISTPDNINLRPNTGDYTVAFWYRSNVLTDWHTMFNKGYWNAAGGLAIILGAGSIKVCSNTSDSGDIGHGITANTWSFIELSRVNGEAYLFTNGILRKKFAQPQNLNSTLPLALMSGGGIVGGANGYMDEFRYVVGQGWHTENYTLPDKSF